MHDGAVKSPLVRCVQAVQEVSRQWNQPLFPSIFGERDGKQEGAGPWLGWFRVADNQYDRSLSTGTRERPGDGWKVIGPT